MLIAFPETTPKLDLGSRLPDSIKRNGVKGLRSSTPKSRFVGRWRDAMKSRTIEMLERRLEERTFQLQFATRPESGFWLRTTTCDCRYMLWDWLRGLVREQMQVVGNIDAAVSVLSGRSMKS